MPIYMKYEGIQGEAKGNYKGWIELESCQLGTHRNITNPTGSGANSQSNAPSISDIVITKYQDSSSAHLFREALHGEGKKVTIDFVKSGDCGAPYLSIELENTLISNFNISGGGVGHDKPMESLSLSFTKISFSTKATECAKDPTAVKDRAMWDLATK